MDWVSGPQRDRRQELETLFSPAANGVHSLGHEQYDALFGSVGATNGHRPLHRRLRSAGLRGSERAWRHLPAGARDSRPARAYGSLAHALVRSNARLAAEIATEVLLVG